MKIQHLLLGIISATNSLSAIGQSDTVQQVVPHRKNAATQDTKPYVILISVDGLRADFVKKYNAQNILQHSRKGVMAPYMLSSYPSLTFPNHYSMVTGLYPAHHGLVDNMFYDPAQKTQYEMHNRRRVTEPRWYGGKPLWTLAEEQKMVTAAFYWVGSNAPVKNILPTYSYLFTDSISIIRRLQIIRQWLTLPKEIRPHFLAIYFPEVDHAAHDFGPESVQTEEAVHLIDKAIGRLTAITDSLHLPVNYLVVSDHGMTRVDVDHPIETPEIIKDTSLCIITGGATLLHVYIKDKTKVESTISALKKIATDFDVYPLAEVPARWHYDAKNDLFHRIGDIVLVPHFQKVFRLNSRKITPGKHGYDPVLTDMHATFAAWGPNIKTNVTLSPFENVNIYPLVAKILGLTIDVEIDGKMDTLESIRR